MPDWTLPMTGGCRCSQTRFAISAPPLLTMACHCSGCQRMTASAFSHSVAVLTEAFTVTGGEPVIGGLHGPSHHRFCPNCMSWLYTQTESMEWFTNVRATMLDDPSWFVPFVETWTSERLPWAATPAPHSFPELPPLDTYEDLIRAFVES
jgi:hypothetical protein